MGSKAEANSPESKEAAHNEAFRLRNHPKNRHRANPEVDNPESAVENVELEEPAVHTLDEDNPMISVDRSSSVEDNPENVDKNLDPEDPDRPIPVVDNLGIAVRKLEADNRPIPEADDRGFAGEKSANSVDDQSRHFEETLETDPFLPNDREAPDWTRMERPVANVPDSERSSCPA